MPNEKFLVDKISRMSDKNLAYALRDIEIRTDKMFASDKEPERDYSELETLLIEEICKRFCQRELSAL